jgi:serine/threonine-protein kinase
MELDDLKTAWQTLDRRLDAQTALNLHIFKDGKLDKARRGLRPLFWGQIAQILFGVALILYAASFWSQHHDVSHLLIVGVSVHVYGVLTIIFAGVTLSMINRIDYAAPVVSIQKQVGQLRRFYVRTNIGLGLAWWVLWIPLTMIFFMDMFGADLYADAPELIYSGTVISVVGLLLTWGFHRWSRHPSRPRMAKAVEDSVTGSSLTKAQRVLDEIANFEQS